MNAWIVCTAKFDSVADEILKELHKLRGITEPRQVYVVA